MIKVKIYGAGSIGNHLAFACRSMGWNVLICDVDDKALERTKNSIYPDRYGSWDHDIQLSLVKDLPKEYYDIVIIGTPPDSHLDLAIKIIKEEKPQILLIEKPLCPPSLENAQYLHDLSTNSETIVCVGYNHVLTKNTIEAEKILNEEKIGQFVSMHAGFQEHWGGIFKAHPWLAGPHESYLGFSKKGGGACGEHSHALNIWQHFASVLNLGKINEISASMDFIEDEMVAYDRICHINVKTEKGFFGSIIQDVVTKPPKKHVRIQGSEGFAEWHVNKHPGADAVIWQHNESDINEEIINKKRPDDFKWEIEHLNEIMEERIKDSPISLEKGLETMMVIAAAHLSHQQKRVMHIDYEKGYRLESIQPA